MDRGGCSQVGGLGICPKGILNLIPRPHRPNLGCVVCLDLCPQLHGLISKELIKEVGARALT